MTKKVTITDHVERFVAMKQKLGWEFTRDAQLLRRFARFADDRNETFIRSETAVECASASTAGSQSERVRMLHTVHALACCLHAVILQALADPWQIGDEGDTELAQRICRSNPR